MQQPKQYNKLSNIGLLEKKKIGKNNYYYNMRLYDLFTN